jgi:Arc/MetJ-type ribon-helix-helix transcriptional regulator
MRKDHAVTISFRLPKKLIEEIDRIVEQGMFQSRSDFVRQAIRYYLIKLQETEKPKPVMG